MNADLEQGGRGWAVIEIVQCYDDIESVECVACFSTREEAEKHFECLMDERRANHGERFDYAEEYIRNLKSTCCSDADWKRVLVERFGPYVKDAWRGYDMDAPGYYTHSRILDIGSSKLDDFYPPAKLEGGHLYVLEVPPCG